MLMVVDRFRLPYILEVRPSPEFNYEAAKSKLINTPLRFDHGPQMTFITPADAYRGVATDDPIHEGGIGRRGNLLRLSGLVELDSHVTVDARVGYIGHDEADLSRWDVLVQS